MQVMFLHVFPSIEILFFDVMYEIKTSSVSFTFIRYYVQQNWSRLCKRRELEVRRRGGGGRIESINWSSYGSILCTTDPCLSLQWTWQKMRPPYKSPPARRLLTVMLDCPSLGRMKKRSTKRSRWCMGVRSTGTYRTT